MALTPAAPLCTCLTSALLPCRAHTSPAGIAQRHEANIEHVTVAERVARIVGIKRWRPA